MDNPSFRLVFDDEEDVESFTPIVFESAQLLLPSSQEANDKESDGTIGKPPDDLES
jgi:hypothetical protein